MKIHSSITKIKPKLASIVLVVMILIAFTACNMQTEFSDKEKPPLATQIPMPINPKPKFIARVSPLPNEQVSLEDFQRFDEQYLAIGIPNKTTGYDKTICVELNVEYLVDNYDEFTNFENTLTKSTLIVNDIISSKISRASSSDMLIIDESKLAQYTSPHVLCWEVNLVEGIHKIEFQFERSSGKIQGYIWYFEILN